MKKFCILFMLFSFISVMPCFALKIIVNENTDRTVPSRSSSPADSYEEDYSMEETGDMLYDQQQRPLITRQSEYNNQKYELVYKPLLGANIRPELVGTTWNYPVNNMPPKVDENMRPVNNDVNNANNQEPATIVKRYLREAADYYVLDTINHPKDIIPAGFEEIIQE